MKRAVVLLAVMLVLATVPAVLAQGRAAPAASQPAQPPKSEPGQPPKVEPGRLSSAEPAEWAPADALFYLGVTDIGQTWDDFKKTAGYALLSDPALAEALPSANPLGSVFVDVQDRVAKALDVPAAQLKNPLAGPLTVYFAAPPRARPEDTEFGLVAGVGDAVLMKKYYDTVVGKLKGTARHEAVSADADTIDVFTADPEKQKATAKAGEDEFSKLDRGKQSPFGGSPDEMVRKTLDRLLSAESMPAKLALCLTQDRLIVAATPERVQSVLQREKRGRTLADTDDHQALLAHLKPTGTVRVLVNLPRVLDLVKAVTTGSEAEELRKWLKMIGADSLGSVVGHLRVGASSYDSKAELLFLMSGQRTGLAKLLSMDNLPTAPPASVAAGTCIYAACNLNVPQLLDDIEQIIRQADPAEADKLRAALETQTPDGEIIDYRKEFLSHLRGPLTATFAFAQPLGPNCLRLLVGLGHADQAALANFLSGPGTQGLLQPRDLRGTQVFDLPGLPPFLPAGLALAPTKDRLVLGNKAAVEAALGPAPSEPLSGTEAWKRVARVVPEQAWLTVYIDQRGLLDALLELARKKDELLAAGPAGMDFGAMLLMGILESMSQGAPGGDLGRIEKVAKNVGQTMYTIATTKAGVQLTVVQLKPEK